MVGIWAGKFLYWKSFSVTGQVGGCLRCWFPLTGLPWTPPAVHGICIGPLPALAWTSSQAYQLVMSLNYMKQINSMLRCICSVTDHSRCQNMVRTPVKPLLSPSTPLFCSYRILTPSVIYYWTDVQQHGIYLFNWCLQNLLAITYHQYPFPPLKLPCNLKLQGVGERVHRDECTQLPPMCSIPGQYILMLMYLFFLN